MKARAFLQLSAAITLLGYAAVVPSATDSTTFTVTATVSTACSISAANLNFGTYDILAGIDTDATTTVTVTCTSLTGYDIGLDAGIGTGATVATRVMEDGSSNTLNYTLYQDTLRSTVWGNTQGSDTISGTGTGLAIPHVVYGRIPTGQTPPPGTYTDTITATVYF